MKLIIDIPDTQYNNIMEVKSMSLGRIPYKGIIMNAIKGIQKGTPISDNATNADVIRALFPDGIPKDIVWTLQDDKGADWWNAPYQKGGK